MMTSPVQCTCETKKQSCGVRAHSFKNAHSPVSSLAQDSYLEVVNAAAGRDSVRRPHRGCILVILSASCLWRKDSCSKNRQPPFRRDSLAFVMNSEIVLRKSNVRELILRAPRSWKRRLFFVYPGIQAGQPAQRAFFHVHRCHFP